MVLWWAGILAIFYPVKVKKYWSNNIYWRFIQNHLRTLSKTIWKRVCSHHSVKDNAYDFTKIENYIGAVEWTHGVIFKENRDLSSAFEKADSQWEQIFESRHSRTKIILDNRQLWNHQNNLRTTKNSAKNSNIYFFLEIFHNAENGDKDRSSVEHLKIQKPVEVLRLKIITVISAKAFWILSGDIFL